MAVVVDNTTYALEPNVTFPIIYSAKAPKKLPQVYGPLDDIHRIESKLHRDNEMPTIHIVGNQPELDEMNHSITADISVKTDIAYASLYNALNFEDVKISLAGQSTRGLSKVSYNLKSKQKSPLYGYRHVKLGSLAMDSSYMREQLAYDMLKSVGLTSIGFSYAHVFMNERELGLFGLFDTFKSSWLANVFANGSSSYENGYLYQGVFQGSKQYEADLFYIDNITAYSDGEYKVKQKASNGESDNYEPLMEFTKFIANASSEWNSKLVIDSFLRPAVMESLIGNSDGNGKNDLDDTWNDMIKEDIDWDKALSRVNSNSASSAPLGQNGNGNNQTIPSITVQGNSTGIPQGMQNMTAMAENRGNMGISVSMKEWLASVYQNTTNFYSK
ncbi:hypothetical protein CU097_005599 [Rhizopus azygosporus]|uniref:Uncharacterized protein n=1 Tax=Rhizopus azygosporus TaxID=86630 RepID=A0A367JWL1_RHIAZ|nr:hypothetical protein CU097_005599 [Rhizopus azygosporus]